MSEVKKLIYKRKPIELEIKIQILNPFLKGEIRNKFSFIN